MTWVPFAIFGGVGGGGGGTTITGLGPWSSSATYTAGQLVSYLTTIYVATASTSAAESPVTHPAKWRQIDGLTVVIKTSHGLVSGDVGKPLGKQESDVVVVWDDTADPQTEYPIGVLAAVIDANAYILATNGAVLDIPAALVTVAGSEPVGAGSTANSRFLYWDTSADEYVTESPADAELDVETVYYIAKNADGSHKVQVLGMRPSGEVAPLVVQTNTDTTYTLEITDAETLMQFNNGSPGTWTIPANATTAFPIGTTIALAQVNAAVTIAPDGGVTLISQGSRFTTNGAGAMATLIKVDTDTWRLDGNLVA